MRHAVILLIIAALLTVGGTYLSQNEGSVRFIFALGTYEMHLWYFVVASLLTVIALMLIVKVIWAVLRLPKVAAKLGKNRRQVVANKLLQKGIQAMEKGEWKKSEKMLVKGHRLTHKDKGNSSLFLSNAAQAAQQQGADARRDQYLLEARQLSVEGVDILTSSLSEARLHLAAKKPKLALEVIKPHNITNGQNPQLLAIKSEANEQLGNYKIVWHILSDLKKQFPDKTDYQIRQKEVAKTIFIDTSSDLNDIERVWSELPKVIKQEDDIFLAYVSGLINHGQEEKAEKLLSKHIRKNYTNSVIQAYTKLEVGSSATRLEKTRNWLSSEPDNLYLNYGAANFAFQSEQFEEARDYALASIKSHPIPESLALLGKIYEALDESSSALNAYKGSLGLIYFNQTKAVSGEVLPAAEKSYFVLSGATKNKENDDELNNSTAKEENNKKVVV